MIATWRLVARNPRRDCDLGAHTGVASHARWGARLHDVSTITREQLLAFMREELYAVQASVSASYSEGTDDAQWIVNQDADGDGVTDYVYGTLTATSSM